MVAEQRTLQVQCGQKLGSFEVPVYERGSGPPLLFVHGVRGLQWDEYLDELAQNFHVYAPLTPGYGESSTEVMHDWYDLITVYFDILDQLDLRGLPVVAHSIGGMLAAELAALQPERFTKLVLIAPMGLWNEQHPVMDIFSAHAREVGPAMYADPNSEKARYHAGGPQAVADRPDPEEFLQFGLARTRAMMQAARWMWPLPNRGLNRRIHRVKQPTLLVWGEQDGVVPPAYAEDFKALLANAETRTIANAAHMVTLEQPQELARVTREFLQP